MFASICAYLCTEKKQQTKVDNFSNSRFDLFARSSSDNRQRLRTTSSCRRQQAFGGLKVEPRLRAAACAASDARGAGLQARGNVFRARCPMKVIRGSMTNPEVIYWAP